LIFPDTNVMAETLRRNPARPTLGAADGRPERLAGRFATRNRRDFLGLELELIDPWVGNVGQQGDFRHDQRPMSAGYGSSRASWQSPWPGIPDRDV
jgi:hypothetical protein